VGVPKKRFLSVKQSRSEYRPRENSRVNRDDVAKFLFEAQIVISGLHQLQSVIFSLMS